MLCWLAVTSSWSPWVVVNRYFAITIPTAVPITRLLSSAIRIWLARSSASSTALCRNGNSIRGGDTRGARVVDDSFLLLFNAHDQTLEWTLPPEEYAPAWRLVIDTSGVPDRVETMRAGSTVKVVDKGMVVLQATPLRRKEG